METYARSHTRSRAAATKTATATFSGDNFKKQKPPLFPPSFDAVYSGASKCGATPLAPRPEDYSEIFGGFRSSSSSRACSIPVLDLPAVSDIDSVTSVFDYSEIFAGFHGVDFAVPFDELFQPFDASADGCSSDDAWTPIGTESLSDESDPFASSEKSQCFSHDDSHQTLDSKKFTVSYHKVNSGASSCVPNMTHVEAVHGYTCVVDGTTSLREMETGNGTSFVADDIVFGMNSSSSTFQKHKGTTMSGNSFDAGLKSVDTGHTCERPCSSAASMSHANSKYAFVPGTNIQTESHLPPPSIPPPVLTEGKGDMQRSAGLKASNGYASKVPIDSRLPPCFDMEVNASSTAAVSAAAMKDAMDKAQAKLKAAKVLLDRRKDGVQPYMMTDVNGSNDIVLDCADGNNKVLTPCESGPACVHSFVKDGHVTSTSQSLPSNVSVEQPKVLTRKAAEKKHGKQCSLSKDTMSSVEASEWKEATWYNDKSRLAALAPSNNGGHVAVCKQQDEDGSERSSNSAEEACLPEGNRRKLKATIAVSRQEYHDRLMRVAQQVHESDISVHAKTDARSTGFSQENNRDHRANLGNEPEKNVSTTIGPGQSTEGESVFKAASIEATKGRSNNVPRKEEFKQKETEDHHQGWNDGVMYAPQQSRIQEIPERKEERRMGVSYEKVECEGILQDNMAKQRKQSKHNVVRQKKENEKCEMNGSNSIELFKDDLGGDEFYTACGSLEKGEAKELKKVEDNKSKEFVDAHVVESAQRTCYVHESDKKKDLMQRQENGNYQEADDCRGSGGSLENDILLECHSKCEETSTREIRMQRLRDCLQFSSGDKADQDLKQDNKDEKLERVTEQKTNDKKSVQVSEMEEAVDIQEKSSDAENEEAVSSAKHECDDEDRGSERSSEIELPVENRHLKPSDGANLCESTAEVDPDSLTSESIKPQTEATCFPDVSAWEKNVKDCAVASDEESTPEDAETAAVMDGDKPVGSTHSQMAAIDNEHERVVRGQDSSDVNNIRNKSGGVCYNNDGLRFQDENKKATQSVADPKMVRGSNIEQGRRRILDENHTPFDQDGKVKSTLSNGNNGQNENTRDREAACTKTLQKKECTPRRSQLPNNSLNTEKKGMPIDHNCSYEVKSKGKERSLEEVQLRKLEEEREREREREKDRMAVELAIREARQRAYADARDRAERSAFERATDETRQKAMAEARERLEKACAEARERSLADKTSEARLRAERAAVERATAEARQRAFEKAMAERATLEARERMQRSISEKFTTERDVITRQSSMPTMHNVKSEAPDGEPAQRCRARLERHRRTVERVAKALAEKNMRDLVAQREQAERSRLAETLDADIKRWSSGKEGNLRALLSTLQYILAPDSGWQPIPLTEVITAAAVKKAYRKATLCVHPDKLQQRGASIQQKYVCEKVFDLLKDAWNKFNSEEK